jgi:hypothetical protein
MKNELIFGTIIGKMPSLNKSFVKFLSNLVFVILSARGRKNFTNMSRWSSYNELSFRRNYDKTFGSYSKGVDKFSMWVSLNFIFLY